MILQASIQLAEEILEIASGKVLPWILPWWLDSWGFLHSQCTVLKEAQSTTKKNQLQNVLLEFEQKLWKWYNNTCTYVPIRSALCLPICKITFLICVHTVPHAYRTMRIRKWINHITWLYCSINGTPMKSQLRRFGIAKLDLVILKLNITAFVLEQFPCTKAILRRLDKTSCTSGIYSRLPVPPAQIVLVKFAFDALKTKDCIASSPPEVLKKFDEREAQ